MSSTTIAGALQPTGSRSRGVKASTLLCFCRLDNLEAPQLLYFFIASGLVSLWSCEMVVVVLSCLTYVTKN
jgi:hypothetical protein